MARPKGSNYEPRTPVEPSPAPERRRDPPAFDPVNIYRIRPDGSEIRRQCNRPDLPEYKARGFKVVELEN